MDKIKQGVRVEFKAEDQKTWTGIVHGIGGEDVLNTYYIVEVDSGHIPSDVYPYSHCLVPSNCIVNVGGKRKKDKLRKETHSGYLEIRDEGESEDVLFLSNPFSGADILLANRLDWMCNNTVSVRYWITDEPCTVEEASDAFLRRCFGDAEVEFYAHYSDLTGYLWTDEELNVGGHDLLAEFKSFKGKWLILEVEECEENND